MTMSPGPMMASRVSSAAPPRAPRRLVVLADGAEGALDVAVVRLVEDGAWRSRCAGPRRPWLDLPTGAGVVGVQ